MANVRRFTFRCASSDEAAKIESRQGGSTVMQQDEVRVELVEFYGARIVKICFECCNEPSRKLILQVNIIKHIRTLPGTKSWTRESAHRPRTTASASRRLCRVRATQGLAEFTSKSEVMEAHYGLYTWPAAEILARHLWHERANLSLDGASTSRGRVISQHLLISC